MANDYEPPISAEGDALDFSRPPQLMDGVTGYAIAHGDEIWIPLIGGDGTGKVGRLLDSLSPRCVIVNVTNSRLRGILERRGWVCTRDDEGVDTWRKTPV